jgi:hypothetical protein
LLNKFGIGLHLIPFLIDPSPVSIIDSGAVIVKVPPVTLLKVEADI